MADHAAPDAAEEAARIAWMSRALSALSATGSWGMTWGVWRRDGLPSRHVRLTPSPVANAEAACRYYADYARKAGWTVLLTAAIPDPEDEI